MKKNVSATNPGDLAQIEEIIRTAFVQDGEEMLQNFGEMVAEGCRKQRGSNECIQLVFKALDCNVKSIK